MIKKGKAFIELRKRIGEMILDGQTEIKLNDLMLLSADLNMDEFNKSLSGKEVAEIFSDFINSASLQAQKDFINSVVSDHRTLQSDMFSIFFSCLEEWSDFYRTGYYDARNEGVCKLSNTMINSID